MDQLFDKKIRSETVRHCQRISRWLFLVWESYDVVETLEVLWTKTTQKQQQILVIFWPFEVFNLWQPFLGLCVQKVNIWVDVHHGHHRRNKRWELQEFCMSRRCGTNTVIIVGTLSPHDMCFPKIVNRFYEMLLFLGWEFIVGCYLPKGRSCL